MQQRTSKPLNVHAWLRLQSVTLSSRQNEVENKLPTQKTRILCKANHQILHANTPTPTLFEIELFIIILQGDDWHPRSVLKIFE